MSLSTDSILKKSTHVVFRKIENEYILVPIVASSAEIDSIFNLNETGAAVWERFDGVTKLSVLIKDISSEFETREADIEKDVMDFVHQMIEARLVEVL